MHRNSLFFVTALTGILSLAGCKDRATANAPVRGGPAAPQVVEVIPIERRDLSETINLVGSLQPNESAEIRAEVGGIVQGIQFNEGQHVAAGDVLLKIDDAELRAQFEQVAARFKLAELNVTRSENLSQSRTIPQSEYDRARSEYAAAKAELEVLKLRLDKTTVKAPFAGIVGSRTISPGDYVGTSTVITRIDDLSRLKITFAVPERYLAKVHPGTKVTATTRGGGVSQFEKTIAGEVYFVSSSIDRDIRASEVKAVLTDPDEALRPGMFANVELVLDVRKNILTVPEAAILADARGVQIIAVADKDGIKVARYVPVVTGLRTRGFVEVAPVDAELDDGTQIVASGVGALVLYPGAPLEPKPLRAPFNQEP
ncbi:MAG: efflux RND transporter periplasmic adaptor subunit [Cephaloticoccus sp.]|nr:efflux RND transporter periplasmic adaptor subunit [Cephaloticoccus sp.]